jgi:hypothetical protein
MKFANEQPFANPEAAARKLVGIGIAVEVTQDIHIEKINGPFLFELKRLPAEYKASDRRRRSIRSYFGPLVSRSRPRKAL